MKKSVILAYAKIVTSLRDLTMPLMILLLISYVLLPPVSYAQESSQSGSIVEKINALKTEIASKAAQLKTEMTKKVQNKAILGTILDITDTEITIQTLETAKIVKYDEFTEVRGLKNKEIKIDSLEEGDKIAALGDMDDQNNLITQRLVFLESIASNSAELVWGQIEKSQGPNFSMKTKSGQTEKVITNSQTAFFLGNNEASILDAKVEKHVLVRAIRQKDNSLRAKFIYFIPSMGFLKPDKIKSATASAKI